MDTTELVDATDLSRQARQINGRIQELLTAAPHLQERYRQARTTTQTLPPIGQTPAAMPRPAPTTSPAQTPGQTPSRATTQALPPIGQSPAATPRSSPTTSSQRPDQTPDRATTPPATAPRPAPTTTAPQAKTPAPATTTPPPAAPAPTALNAAAIAALPFRIELPAGLAITPARAGADANIYRVQRGDQTLLMIYAGPSSQFPIYDGERVRAGGRASVVVTEGGRRLAMEHLFQRATAPKEIHVWITSVTGADRDLAERIGQSIDVR